MEFRPPGQPHWGGVIERLIGTMMQLMHQIPGTTFSNIEERDKYNSEKFSVLTFYFFVGTSSSSTMVTKTRKSKH